MHICLFLTSLSLFSGSWPFQSGIQDGYIAPRAELVFLGRGTLDTANDLGAMPERTLAGSNAHADRTETLSNEIGVTDEAISFGLADADTSGPDGVGGGGSGSSYGSSNGGATFGGAARGIGLGLDLAGGGGNGAGGGGGGGSGNGSANQRHSGEFAFDFDLPLFDSSAPDKIPAGTVQSAAIPPVQVPNAIADPVGGSNSNAAGNSDVVGTPIASNNPSPPNNPSEGNNPTTINAGNSGNSAPDAPVSTPAANAGSSSNSSGNAAGTNGANSAEQTPINVPANIGGSGANPDQKPAPSVDPITSQSVPNGDNTSPQDQQGPSVPNELAGDDSNLPPTIGETVPVTFGQVFDNLLSPMPNEPGIAALTVPNPEPSSIVIWAAVLGAGLVWMRKRQNSSAKSN